MLDRNTYVYKNAFLLTGLGLCFAISLLPMTRMGWFLDMDIAALSHLNLSRNPSWDTFFRIITASAGVIAVLTPLLLFCIPRFRKPGIYAIAAYLAAIASSSALKYLLNRSRPFIAYPFIKKLTDGGSPSFPSGHTTDAFVTAGVLSLVFRRWYVTAVAYLWAVLVAYSRMDLGVHYPSDVLAGAALGSMAALACFGLKKEQFKYRSRRVA